LAWMFKASVDPTGASVNFREPAPAFVRALPGMAEPQSVGRPSTGTAITGPTVLPSG
jgi:hypothetical protein